MSGRGIHYGTDGKLKRAHEMRQAIREALHYYLRMHKKLPARTTPIFRKLEEAATNWDNQR